MPLQQWNSGLTILRDRRNEGIPSVFKRRGPGQTAVGYFQVLCARNAASDQTDAGKHTRRLSQFHRRVGVGVDNLSHRCRTPIDVTKGSRQKNVVPTATVLLRPGWRRPGFHRPPRVLLSLSRHEYMRADVEE